MLLTCCCSQQSGYPNSPEMLLWTSFRLFVWSKPAVFKLHFFPLPILKANYQTMSLLKAGLPSRQHITKTQQDRNSFSSRPQGHSSAQIWPKSLPSISTHSSDGVSNKHPVFRRGHLFSWSFLLGCSNEIPYKLDMYTFQLCWTGWGMRIKMLSGHLSRIYECTWRKKSVVLRHHKSL